MRISPASHPTASSEILVRSGGAACCARAGPVPASKTSNPSGKTRLKRQIILDPPDLEETSCASNASYYHGPQVERGRMVDLARVPWQHLVEEMIVMRWTVRTV